MPNNVIKVCCFLGVGLISANKTNAEPVDMSNPLAIYSQAGVGVDDKGFNFKFGQISDTGSNTSIAMNVLEINGLLGDAMAVGSDGSDSIDSIRFRNFQQSLIDGRGRQLDIEYDLNQQLGAVSYSLTQILAPMGAFSLFPLAGGGISFANDMDYSGTGMIADVHEGFSIPGVYVVIGMYSIYNINEKLWFNYNPMWRAPVAGAEIYKNSDNTLSHEVAVGYQINLRCNVRYFANWDNHGDFLTGGHRVELNYQL
ncbi:MAG: hypothetical protein HRU20_29870 [Pseudomonadales bacterium]|nr:hypothetical protein [Pseudomonadales bacterium]